MLFLAPVVRASNGCTTCRYIQICAAPEPPSTHNCMVLTLCHAGKMPLNPEAFAKTKAALGVQLASTLASASGAHVTATEEALEVLWQGFAFKLILYLDRCVPYKHDKQAEMVAFTQSWFVACCLG